MSWLAGVASLSQVALPFASNDPLYGRRPPENEEVLLRVEMAMLGERGLLVLPGDWLRRMRYNPFYDVIDDRTLEWFDKHSTTAPPETE